MNLKTSDNAVAAWLNFGDVELQDNERATKSRLMLAWTFVALAVVLILVLDSPVGFAMALGGMLMVLLKHRITATDTRIMYTLMLFIVVFIFGRFMIAFGLFWPLVMLMAAAMIGIWAKGRGRA